jgi:hypothetical protein
MNRKIPFFLEMALVLKRSYAAYRVLGTREKAGMDKEWYL